MSGRSLAILTLVWLGLLALVEATSWAVLKVAQSRHATGNALITEYLDRRHPLFADNEDLRARNQNFAFHPLLGYTLIPDHTYLRPHNGYTSSITTDSLALVHNGDKTRNPTLLKGPDTPNRPYRILFLGGSTMFGLGASTNATTIPAQFESLAREKWPGKNFQVINGGVMGYQSSQERIYYELFLSRHRPDLVIALDGVNDAMMGSEAKVWRPHYNNSMLLTPEGFLHQFKPSAALASWAGSLLSFPQPLYSLAVLRRVVDHLKPPTPPITVGAYHHPEAAEQLAANLDGLAWQLKAQNIAGLFALQPYLGLSKGNPSPIEQKILSHYGDHITVYNRFFTDFAERYAAGNALHGGSNIRFIDLRHLFAHETRHIYESIAHYNDDGNAILARTLLDAATDAIENGPTKGGRPLPMDNQREVGQSPAPNRPQGQGGNP